jgi:hypothetical protein
MVNWLNFKKLIALICIIVLSSFKTNKWGFTGHKKINQIAVFALPPELIGFYKTYIDYITDHAVDPDKRRHSVQFEAPKHYIDLEHYCPNFPTDFDSIPKKWKNAVLKYTEDSLYSYGIVPWHVVHMKYQLQKAFEEKNYDQILKLSSDIGHYIADAHVPLHTTENYNGQLTNQKGIHGLWESRLVETHLEDMKLFTGKAKYIENMETFIWQVVFESHLCLDSVFNNEKNCTAKVGENNKYTIETRGRTTVKTYSREFSDCYYESLNGMVERRLKQSILAVASIWYTAWVDAGQPKLNFDKKITLDNSNNLEEIKTNTNHKYRNCD